LQGVFIMSELVKDRGCIHCEKFFECKGKPRGALCVNFEERKDDDGRRKVDKDNNGYFQR
jgi:hypothetical protein